ncbi:contactin-5-like [Tubulanus polymorphus]|uniref:contactin-5-like n=1 Tax=Tubulanus polymorphus TaxID=672921 RepID=UPI003DA49B86
MPRMYRNCLVVTVVLCLMACREVNGQQLNCIHEADTTIMTVATPAVVKLGGTTVVQCQVSPPSKNVCGFRISLSGPSEQFGFDKTNCPRGAISEPRYTGQCDVTAGRYGLRINNIQMTDAGEWSCDYMNSFRNTRTVITVVAPPSGPVLTSQPNAAINNIVKVREYSPLTIICDGSQPGATGLTYKWSGANLSGQSNNKLRFQPVRRTDSGVYTCTGSNLAGSVTGNITIDVLYPPSGVTFQGPTSPVQESTSANFTCTATGGNPEPNLAITRTPEGSAVIKQGGSPLTYSTSVTKTDNQAVYRCRATGAGIPTPMISNQVKLTVNYAADSVSLTPVKSVIVKGTSIRFRCAATGGNPDSYIYNWQFSTAPGVWKPITSRNANYVIDNSSRSDSGQYRCRATNIGGFTISNIATVDVQYAPILIGQVNPIAANKGDVAKFTINYDANPSATTLTCNRNLTDDGTVPIKTGLTQWHVIIISVRTSDYESYSCSLNNSVGSIIIDLKLIETGPPHTPSYLAVIAKTAVSVTLSWVSEFAGGSEQMFTVSYMALDSTQIVDAAGIPDPGYRKPVQIKITGLKPATDYQFKAKSVNLNPTDNTSPFSNIVTTKTNAIPNAINFVLKRATIKREGNLVQIKSLPFPSKYSFYVEYCIENTKQCRSTKPMESTDVPINIMVTIDPDQAYSYKLIVTEGGDVIVSQQIQIHEDDDKTSETSLVPAIIAGVVLGSIACTLMVILLVVLLIRLIRNGGLVFLDKSSGMKTKANDSTTVYSNSNENEIETNDTNSRPYAAATPYMNVAFGAELEMDPNCYEEIKN